jgi:DhnA family fructose-bisphosphate aldolase class Ia
VYETNAGSKNWFRALPKRTAEIIPLVRQAVELGADTIKADPTDDVAVYHKVIEIAGRVPVLVRGGGKVPDDEVLRRTEQLIQQEAAGIVYGRNVIQHAKLAGMTRALMAIVHATNRGQVNKNRSTKRG